MTNILRTGGRIIYRFFEGFTLLIAAWLLFAIALPEFKLNTAFVPPQHGVEIFIRSNGVHTDFVLPSSSMVHEWKTQFPPETFDADSTYKYIAIGWGDKGFFLDCPTWGDLTFGTAFTAASGIGESAVHVDYIRGIPQENARYKKYIITELQYAELSKYIMASLQLSNEQPVLIDHAGYGKHDLFFEANGSYSLFNTCNEWTGDGMEACGLPVGLWTPLEPGIMKR